MRLPRPRRDSFLDYLLSFTIIMSLMLGFALAATGVMWLFVHYVLPEETVNELARNHTRHHIPPAARRLVGTD